jgi:serine/threonine-protein kinase
MGVVVRARDVKLQRDVALKLLPDHFADDADRLSRFLREAQILASLNHPNIAQIYGLEESATMRCIVMELVEGQTLGERILRGPMNASCEQHGGIIKLEPPATSVRVTARLSIRSTWTNGR